MDVGTFSLSINTQDLAAAMAFYGTLGFDRIDGDGESWVMLANGDAKIGLFQQMFDTNIITFNPPDAREVEAALSEAGYTPISATEGTEGPAHFMIQDPDGNMILFDQHQ